MSAESQIDAADRLEQLERQVFDLNSLIMAGRALHNILEPEKLYEVLLAIVAEKLESGPMALFVYDAGTRVCRLVRTHRLPDAAAPGFSFVFDEGLLWQHVLQGIPFAVTSASGAPLFERIMLQQQLSQFHANLWVPLFLKDRCIGLLTLGNPAPDAPYDEADLGFLTQFAATAASSINMCLLYVKRNEEKEELSRTFRNLSMLYNISRAMTHISDLKQLLGYILEQAIALAGARKGSIMLYSQEQDQLEIHVIEGLENKEAQRQINTGELACSTFRPGEGVCGRVFSTGQALVVNDINEATQFVKAAGSYVESIACIPMKVHGECIGVINVTNKKDNAPFADQDVSLLTAIADQAAVAINKAQLWELSVTDSLTGLHIRRYLLARLNDELLRSRRFGHSLSVVLCDIDFFKRVNDQHGHDTGDRVLKEVARVLQASARSIDHVARYGGEEFVFLLVETDKGAALAAADRLRREVESLALPDLPRVTLSLGVASFPDDGDDIENLIHKADLALYHAKQAGRNQVVPYRDGLSMPGSPAAPATA